MKKNLRIFIISLLFVSLTSYGQKKQLSVKDINFPVPIGASKTGSVKFSGMIGRPGEKISGQMVSELSYDELVHQCTFFAGDSLSGFDFHGNYTQFLKNNFKTVFEFRNMMYRAQRSYVKQKYNIKNNPAYSDIAGIDPPVVLASSCANLDFEDGNLSNWSISSGYNSNSNGNLTVGGAGTSATNQTIYGCADVNLITGAYGTDAIGMAGLDPNGGSYSARVGGFHINTSGFNAYGFACDTRKWSNTYSNGEILEQTFAVNAANALVSFDYAVVLNDGGHANGEQPYFHVYVKDAATGVVLSTCTQYYVQAPAGSAPPGFANSGYINTYDGSTLYSRNWTSNSMNLTPYIGQTVNIEFVAAGCIAGAHMAWAYVDVTCGPAVININTNPCSGQPVVMSAPAIFGGSYLWSGPGVTGMTTQTVSTSANGTYSVVVTPSQGAACSYTLSKTLSFATTPTISASVSSPTLCSGLATVITPSGGTTYTLVNSGATGTSFNVSPTATTNYTILGTNATACLNSTVVSVSVTSTPTISILSVSSPSLCSGTTSTISPSGATTYTLLNTGATGTSFAVSPSATTTYSIVGATSSCTSNTITTTISVNAPTITPAFTSTTMCAGNSATLTVTGNPSSPTMSFANLTNYAIPDNNTSGVSSTIPVTGLTGSVGTSLLNVNLNINHTYDGDLSIYLVCPGGTTITLSANNGAGGNNYTNTTFSTTGTAITSGAAPFTGTFTPQQAFSGLSACLLNGNWKLFVRDGAGSDVGTLLNWSITFANQNSYTWGPSAGLSPTTGTNVVANPTTTTVYTVTGTDATGCTAAKTITVNINPVPTPTITATNSLCLGASATFTGTGASTYTWSSSAGGGLATTTGSTVTATPTSTGNITYTVNVTGANSCTNTASKTITVNPTPTANAGTPGTLTCTSPTISLSGSGGGTYSWTGPASGIVSGTTSATPVVSVQGTYSLAVTNTASCTSPISTVSISQNTISPTATSSVSAVLNCTLSSVNIVATTTATPVSYTWTGSGITSSSNTYSAAVNQAGTFNYTVTNTSNGCFTTGNQVVTQNIAVPSVSVSANATITCAAPTVTITGSATPSTCTPVWTGGVSSGATSYTATASSSGVYTLTVTDPANGCTAARSLTVSPSAGLPVLSTPAISNSITCVLSTAQVTLSSTPAGNTYAWTGAGITSGATTSVITVNTGATYSVVVTNTLSLCSSSITVLVPTNTLAPSPTASNSTTLTCLTTTAVLTGGPSSGVTYEWSGPSLTGATTNSTAIANGPGTYTLKVTDAVNGCTNTAVTSLTQNTLAPSPTATSPTTLTCLTTTAALTGGPTSGVTYTWTGASVVSGTNTQNAVAGAPGTYTLKVTDAVNSCTNQATTTVAQNITPPSPTASSTLILTCAPGNSVSPLNGGPSSGVTYTWTGPGVVSGSNSQNAIANAPGTYTLKVTDAVNSCTNQAVTTVTQNITPPTPAASVSGSLTCTNSVVTVTATPAAGVTYQWSGPGISGSSTSATAQATVAGVYTVQVTSTTNSCAASATVNVISDYSSPSATASNSATLTCNTTTVLVTGGPLSGVTYTWTGPGIMTSVNNSTIVVNQPGSYDLVITNTVNGCQNNAHTDVIRDISTPTINVTSPSSITCSSPTIALSSTPISGVTYTWTGPGVVSGSNTATPNINVSGTYTIAMTNNSNGCSSNTVVSVPINTTVITPTITVPGILTCTVLSESISASPTSGVTYTWSGSGITAGANTSAVTINQPGTYTLNVTNLVNGCVGTETVTVIQDITPPTATASNSTILTCTTTTGVLTGGGGGTYVWSGPGITAGGATSSPTVNTPGNYTVIVTAANGCTATAVTSVTQNITPPTPTASNSTILTCTTTTGVLTGGGGGTYVWSGPGITAGGATSSPTVNAPGNYTVTVTAANGCTATAVTTVTQNITPPPATASNSTILTCTTTAGVLTAGGGGTYVWSGPGITAGGATSSPTVNAPGNYTVLVTAANGCTATAVTTVTQNITPPSPTASNSTTLTCTTTTAVLTGGGSGTYVWSGPGITAGGTTSSPTVNAPGIYTLTVTAANGCTATATTSLTQNIITPTTTATTTGSITCTTNTVNLSSSLAGMNYTWTAPGGSSVVSGSSLQNAVGQGLGTYTLNVLNPVNGCVFQTSVAAIQNITAPTFVSAGPDQALICNTPTVSLTGSATPTTSIANWLGGVSSPNSFTTSTGAAGVYVLQAINPVTGCFISSTVTVTQSTNNPVVTTNPVTNSITCTNSVVAIGVTVTSTATVSYAWPVGTGISGATNGATTTATLSGVYQVTVTNQGNGCISINPISVSQNTVPVTVGITPASSLSCNNTSVTLNVSTPVGSQYTYTWTGGSIVSGTNTANPIVDLGGTYSVAVTNTINGCVGNSSVSVFQDISTPTVSIASSTIQTTCANPTATLSVTSTPSTGVTYSWTAPGSGSLNTYTVSNPVASGSGIFTVVVTTIANGCSSSLTQNTVEVIPDLNIPTATLSTVTETITCSNPTPTVNIAVSTTSVSYAWTPTLGIVPGTETTATPSFSAIGSYSVVVTNTATGCATSASGNVVTVTENTVVPTMTLSASGNSGILTCTTTSLSITPVITPTANLAYSWSPGMGISTPLNQANATFTAAGSYTLAITNTLSGCTSTVDATSIFTVTENTVAPTFTLGTASSVSMTCASPSVSLSGTSSSDPNSVYTWTTPSSGTVTGNPIIVSTAGIYTVSVTNTVSGCNSSSVGQATVEVIADAGIPTTTLSTATETITCSNLTPTVNIAVSTTSVSYAWTPTLGIVPGTENTATPSFSAIGSYSVVVTNTATGCATSASGNVVTVTENTVVPTMTLSASGNSGILTCTTTAISITPVIIPTTNLTFSWSPGAGISTPLNQANATFTAIGSYTLAITNTLSGCTSTVDATSVFTVTDNTMTPTFTLGTASSVTTTCASPNATLSASSSVDPDAIYTWLTPSSTTLTGSPINVSTAGIYSLVVTNTLSGCSTSSAVSQNTVEVVTGTGIPAVTTSTNAVSITCSNPTPSVSITTTSTPVSYNWSPSSGILPGTETTASPTFTTAGSYSVIVTNTVSGCASSISSNVVTVTMDNTAPVITLSSGTNDGTITCSNPSVPITPAITTSGALSDLTYTWSPSGVISTSINDATFTSAGIYTLAITNTLTGCVTTSTNTANTFTVYGGTTIATPTIAVSSNSTIGCAGTNSFVTLSSSATATNVISTWLPGNIPGQTFTVTAPATYSLVTTDVLTQCSDTTEFTVNGSSTPPQGVDAGTSANISCGNSTATLTGVSTSTNVNYSWSGPSATSIISNGNTPNPIIGETGTYTLTVTDILTLCQSTAAVVVSQANVTASFTANPTTGTTPLTVNFTDSSVGATSWSWNFGDFNSSSLQNPINVYTTGSYTVTLTASSGSCTSTATVVITVEDGLTLEIPNVFTPNADGANDVFSIKSTGIKEISLQIFNRWGEKLYEFSGPKASWDGLAPNGLEVPEGTYFYFVKATGFDDAEIEKHGSVNLFR
ncbi:MAG: hypothetical protein K0S53_1457 [Bacteroidetes bacterium]|jgi:gliding motility-associated-like protein|nr:hypothetical protein [Bacteroidota bacterium]